MVRNQSTAMARPYWLRPGLTISISGGNMKNESMYLVYYKDMSSSVIVMDIELAEVTAELPTVGDIVYIGKASNAFKSGDVIC